MDYFCSMVVVVTGPVHSGKTTLVRRVVSQLKTKNFRLDGYLSPVALCKGEAVGYDLLDLAEERTTPFIRKEGRTGWPRIGPYFLIPETLQKARQKILNCDPRNLLIVDEVGPLELRGQGIWPALTHVLKDPSRDILIVARRPILGELLNLINRPDVEIFENQGTESTSSLLKKIIAATTGRGRETGYS